MRNVVLGLCLCISSTAFGRQVLASFGDSITRGFNAKKIGENTAYNWASGNEISSYWESLFPSHGDRAYNLAIVGATSGVVKLELLALSEIPTHATLLIGANDACYNLPLEDTLSNIKDVIQSLYSRNKDVILTVSPVPRISSIYYAKKNELWCRTVWAVSGICAGFLSPFISDELRNDNQYKLDMFNLSLEEYVNEVNAKEEHPRIHFNPAIGIGDLFSSDVSDIDCFHPSVAGQQRLSDLATILE